MMPVVEDLGVRVADPELGQALCTELLVDDAGARPDDQIVATRLLAGEASKMAVRGEDHGLPIELPEHLHGIRGGADDVAQRLHLRRAVDVGDHLGTGVLLDESLELIGRAAVGQRAARLEIRHHHLAGRIQDLGGLGHEVDPAEDDHVLLDPGGRLGEGQ